MDKCNHKKIYDEASLDGQQPQWTCCRCKETYQDILREEIICTADEILDVGDSIECQ